MRLFNTALPVLYPLYSTSQGYDFHWVLCWLGACMRRSKHRQNCSPEGVKLVNLGLEIKICNASINGILGLWKFKHFLWFWDFGFWRKEKGSSEHSSDREHRFCVLQTAVTNNERVCQIRAAIKAAFPYQLGGKTCYVKWQFMPLMLLLFWHSHKLITGHSHSEQCPCL